MAESSYYYTIFREGLKKAAIKVSRDIRCPGRDSNQASPGIHLQKVTTTPSRSRKKGYCQMVTALGITA
jgi:hypothetical protein